MAKKEENNEGKIPVERKDITPLTPDQLELVNKMISEAMKVGKESAGAVSVYGLRDPQTIESVNVKRIMGKFVIGFKDQQDDPFKKTAKYIVYKDIPSRRLVHQPYITLILSDGKEEEEKEILLSDYYHNRDYYQAKVVDIQKKSIVEAHGLLGSRGMYAGMIDANNNPVAAPKIKAETKREERVFMVELPGFEKPVRFISDYLA